MLTLYYSPGACSLASHIILEALGEPYQTIRVDLKKHVTENGENFYEITLAGAVPVLILPDKTVLTQNTAVLVYLGEQDKTHQLIPKVNTIERFRCHEWLGLISADLHKPFGPLFNAAAYSDNEETQKNLQERAKKIITKVLSIIEKKLTPHQFALGENFTIIDAYLFVFYRWLKHFKFALEETCPLFFALCRNVEKLEAVKTALEKEGF